VSRVCSVCTNPARLAIDAALTGRMGSIRSIAVRHKLSKTAVQRHKQECLPELRQLMREATARVEAGNILAKIRSAAERCQAIVDRAEESDQLSVAVAALRELRGNYELIARLTGELIPQTPASGPVRIEVVYVDALPRQESGNTIEAHVESTRRCE
jgi:hypothetical protein